MQVFQQEPFRFTPAGPPAAYKTYTMLRPAETHTRPVNCETADCDRQANGWVTTINETTLLGQKQAYYIRTQSGRRYIEVDGDGVTLFTFPADQECFETHTVDLDKPSTWIVRGGDWRGNPRRTGRVHDRPEHWVEDFAEHQDRLARSQNA